MALGMATAHIADAPPSPNLGVVILVLTADCTPVLLSTRKAGVIAAAHAGWKGRISGVLENTVALMREHGATRIAAAIGPLHSSSPYEVGPEFEAASGEADANYARSSRLAKTANSSLTCPHFVQRA